MEHQIELQYLRAKLQKDRRRCVFLHKILHLQVLSAFSALHLCKVLRHRFFSFDYFTKNPFCLQCKFVKRKGFIFYYKDFSGFFNRFTSSIKILFINFSFFMSFQINSPMIYLLLNKHPIGKMKRFLLIAYLYNIKKE